MKFLSITVIIGTMLLFITLFSCNNNENITKNTDIKHSSARTTSTSFSETVPQGSHNATPYGIGWGAKISPNAMFSKAKFNASAMYNLGNSNQNDWNKIFGLNSGLAPNYIECRWGWRWSVTNNCLEIYPYVRHNGAIIFDNSLVISNVPLNTWLDLSIVIKRSENKYVFTYGNITKVINVPSLAGQYTGLCTHSSLYFGGNAVAPNPITVQYQDFGFATCIRLFGATQTWSVAYTDADGHAATAEGGPGDDFTINCQEGTATVVFGNVKVSQASSVCY
jgi:hypothetical protein